MAEYKNGFNAFGGIPVDSNRRSPELHTGRAVYINDDKYSEESNYKNKADSIVREGYHKEAPFEAPEIIVPEPIIPSGTKNITENGTYDVAQFAKAEVNVAGGGSSDFSTAKLTVNVSDNINLYGAAIVAPPSGITLPIEVVTVEDLSNGEYDVVLYNGNALVTAEYDPIETPEIIVIGAIEKFEEEEGSIVYKITGDCTITTGQAGSAAA